MERPNAQELFARMEGLAKSGRTLQLPPNCFTEMKAEVLTFEDGLTLTVIFPNDPRYHNPLGLMQGGFIVAAIDNTLGPLSYLVAPPSVTTQLNTTYIRPVTPRDSHIVVHGEVLEKSRTQLHLKARVVNPAGKLIAMAFATCQILNDVSARSTTE